jgi:hypothetical protein
MKIRPYVTAFRRTMKYVFAEDMGRCGYNTFRSVATVEEVNSLLDFVSLTEALLNTSSSPNSSEYDMAIRMCDIQLFSVISWEL